MERFLVVIWLDSMDTLAPLGVIAGVVVVGYLLWKLLRHLDSRAKADAESLEPEYCTRCGTVAPPQFQEDGHPFVAAILLVLFILPGVIYWMWQRSTQRWVCSKCGNESTIPVNSPVAQQALSQR